MESSQVCEGSEECHSSESGWTMYIGSPLQEQEEDDDGEQSVDSDDGGEEEVEDDANGADQDDDAESDDSMASDASSGPSYRGGHVGGCVSKKQAHSKDDHRKEGLVNNHKPRAKSTSKVMARKNSRTEKKSK